MVLSYDNRTPTRKYWPMDERHLPILYLGTQGLSHRSFFPLKHPKAYLER